MRHHIANLAIPIFIQLSLIGVSQQAAGENPVQSKIEELRAAISAANASGITDLDNLSARLDTIERLLEDEASNPFEAIRNDVSRNEREKTAQERIRTVMAIRDADDLARGGKHDEALAKLKELRKENPDNTVILNRISVYEKNASPQKPSAVAPHKSAPAAPKADTATEDESEKVLSAIESDLRKISEAEAGGKPSETFVKLGNEFEGLLKLHYRGNYDEVLAQAPDLARRAKDIVNAVASNGESTPTKAMSLPNGGNAVESPLWHELQAYKAELSEIVIAVRGEENLHPGKLKALDSFLIHNNTFVGELTEVIVRQAAGMNGQNEEKVDRWIQVARLTRDAERHHRAGNLSEAENKWREILEIEPGNPTALQKLEELQKKATSAK